MAAAYYVHSTRVRNNNFACVCQSISVQHNTYFRGILVLTQVPTKHSYSTSNYIEEAFFNAMEAGHVQLMAFFPILCLMKTVILHCNGGWKYAVISRVDSSGVWVFRWDLGSTRMPFSINKLYIPYMSYKFVSLSYKSNIDSDIFLVDLNERVSNIIGLLLHVWQCSFEVQL